MKLKAQRVQLEQSVAGVQAGIFRNDILGHYLVIQSGQEAIQIKLSDLTEFLTEQNKEEKPSAETQNSSI